MVKLPKCAVLHTREVPIPDCKDAPEHCMRTFHISLPGILCSNGSNESNQRRLQSADNADKFFEGEYKRVGTIPMVFAFHGTGTDYTPMAGYAQKADEHNFVLILPEGINQSFNAGDCCGDALKLGIHDIDFIYHIQEVLSEEFDFLQPEYSYGIGWDNGGLLLTDAAIESPHLFKAIVPIAGYYTRSEIPPSVGDGIGIMIHHSLDDVVMRPSGVLDSFDLWARSVNHCTSTLDKNGPTGMSTLLVGGGEGIFYSLEQEDGITSMASVSVADDKDQEPVSDLSVSELPLEITYAQDNVVCLTSVSESCVANSSLCVYKEMGHFEGVASTPFMGDLVMGFFARDACSTNGGLWETIESSDTSFCKCTGGIFNGIFCLDKPDDDVILGVKEPLQPSQSEMSSSESLTPVAKGLQPISVFGIVGLVFVVTAAIVFLMRKTVANKSFTKKDSDYTDDEVYGGTNLAIASMSLPKKISPYQDQFYKVKTKKALGEPVQRRGWWFWEKKEEPVQSREERFWEKKEEPVQSRSWRFWEKKEEPYSHGNIFPRRSSEDEDEKSQSGLDHSTRSAGSTGSLKSLDAIDLQLLQMYRKKSTGSDAPPPRNLSLDDQTGLNLDLELLQSYRRRKMEREAYGQERDVGRQTSDISPNDSVHSSDDKSNTLDDFLFTDLFSGDRSDSGNADDIKEAGGLEDHRHSSIVEDEDDDGDEGDAVNSTEYIKSILWDVAMS